MAPERLSFVSGDGEVHAAVPTAVGPSFVSAVGEVHAVSMLAWRESGSMCVLLCSKPVQILPGAPNSTIGDE